MPPETIRQTAAAMLDELRSSQFVVAKWRKEDTWIRGSISQNPEWYQRLCSQHERTRRRYPKSRTIIRRVDVERTLKRIADGIECNGIYGERLLPIIEQEAGRFESVPHTHTHTNTAVF